MLAIRRHDQSTSSGIFNDSAWPSAAAQHSMVAEVLWGTFMGGGMGVEAYFGGGPSGDLVCESWRTRSEWWRYARIAVGFFRTLPFWEMVSADDLVRSNDYCFAVIGSLYVVYHTRSMDSGSGSSVQISGAEGATFSVFWFDALNGGPMQRGMDVAVNRGSQSRTYGSAPSRRGKHWIAVIDARALTPTTGPTVQRRMTSFWTISHTFSKLCTTFHTPCSAIY